MDDQSVVLRSENDGGHWETLLYVSELDNSQSYYTLKSFRNELWLCGREGRILVIDQSGNLLRQLETGALYFRDLEFIDEDNLILEASRKILRSEDGGRSWEVIYGESGGQVIGFDNPDNGLMIQTRNSCPVDYAHSNDLIASTRNGGVDWQGPEETTTNFRYQYVQSQRLEAGRYLLLLRNELLEIREN
ncbi:hypothetical protein CRP01_04300 [Flavilitoribacter nigricans DSM 23189 = NBRC 102662]|uniref:Photosynthesis system II assembly factor Ycf48/Hcf136-like domain-containing protein n=2 Tax=Flavilitoribacter TaxID=2762562 RepID=A0A2D0NHK0_FLAN2|nr:hypothetical protein CRP01_04300 [Flavilitoribacter nigricans DSM 23189 = NBRC 102662]